MKKIIYYTVLLGIALAAASCKDDSAGMVLPGPDQSGDEVSVAFGMDMGKFLTDIEMEPMTRAVNPDDGSYVLSIRKDYMAYILKKIDGDWYEYKALQLAMFDRHKEVTYDDGDVTIPVFNPTGSPDETAASSYYLYRLTADQLTTGFETELTPGDYMITILINHNLGEWAREQNGTFRPGMKIDPSDPPYIIQYSYPDPMYEHGVGGSRTLSLGGEIFVGCKEFTVVKSTDLGAKAPEQFIEVDMERKTAKMRFLLKDREVEGGINFAPTSENRKDGSSNANQLEYELQPTSDVDFYRGVDIFGNFKGEVDHLFLSATFTRTYWMTPLTGTGRYLVSRDGGRTNSLYIFAHPDEQVPSRFGPVKITRMSGTPLIYWDGTADFTLRGNRWHAFSFEMTGEENGSFTMRRSLDTGGAIEDANPMFGPYVEINNY